MSTKQDQRIPETVLVIDNDTVIQNLCKTYLNNMGTDDIICVKTGHEAKRCIAEYNFDLIILDWRLKDIPGETLYSDLRSSAETLGIPIIIMSGQITKSDINLARHDALTNFIIKPFAEEVLLGVVGKTHPGVLPKAKGSKRDLQHIKGKSKPKASDLYIAKQQKLAKGAEFSLEKELKAEQDDKVFTVERKSPKNLRDIIHEEDDDLPLDIERPQKDLAPAPAREKSSIDFRRSLAQFSRKTMTSIKPTEFISTILIVEGDRSLEKDWDEVLKGAGYRSYKFCKNIDEAKDVTRTQSFDVAMLNWQLENPESVALYSYLRTQPSTRTMPILINCSERKKSDFRLLEENPYTLLIDRPWSKDMLIQAMQELVGRIQEHKIHVQIFEELSSKDLESADEILPELQQAVKQYVFSTPMIDAIGRYYFDQGRFKDAEKVFKLGFNRNRECVSFLIGLGNLYHRMNRIKESYELLSKAKVLTSESFENLCLLNYDSIKLTDTERMASVLSKIFTHMGDASSAANQKHQNYMLNASTLESLPRLIASVQNTMGITFVRRGNFAKGVEQYIVALSFTTYKPLMARIEFNLGLAFTRSGQHADAREWFLKAIEHAEPGFTRPKDYLDRAEEAIAEDQGAMAEAELEFSLFDGRKAG